MITGLITPVIKVLRSTTPVMRERREEKEWLVLVTPLVTALTKPIRTLSSFVTAVACDSGLIPLSNTAVRKLLARLTKRKHNTTHFKPF